METNNPARRTYTDAERLERACLRTAMHIRGIWEETGGSDTRLLDSLFISDALTTVGRSPNYESGRCREHVVPRRVIIMECREMLKRGEGDVAIAKLIERHNKIVLISREERDRLDRREHLGLRQSMPKDWTFGGDIYARLHLAGIEWSPRAPGEQVIVETDAE